MTKSKEIPSEIMEKISALTNENTIEWNTNQKNTMYKALRERFGPEVDKLIAENIGRDSYATFKQISILLNDDSLDMFIHLLFDRLPDMGWKMEAKDEDGKFYRKITYCPKFEMAKKIGAEKLMYLLACCSDHYASKGFNQDINMTRNTTLMEGGPCCDFCFQMRKKSER